jgi:hypothetical protein
MERRGDVLVGSQTYPIKNGIPRFGGPSSSVASFGDEWNAFNYDDFLRANLPTWSPAALMRYSRTVAVLRLIPVLGFALEAGAFVIRGTVPKSHTLRQRIKQAALNTYDVYGSHAHQHFLTKEQLSTLLYSLQPDRAKVLNVDKVFSDPRAKAAAFRVFK